MGLECDTCHCSRVLTHHKEQNENKLIFPKIDQEKSSSLNKHHLDIRSASRA